MAGEVGNRVGRNGKCAGADGDMEDGNADDVKQERRGKDRAAAAQKNKLGDGPGKPVC